LRHCRRVRCNEWLGARSREFQAFELLLEAGRYWKEPRLGVQIVFTGFIYYPKKTIFSGASVFETPIDLHNLEVLILRGFDAKHEMRRRFHN
jgi:hypothetical protein